MHDFNSGYASLFNRRYERVGSLFQGRFKAILVEDDSYAWTLSRYIHLNPVRAEIVRRPQQYAWSSYRHFLNSRGAPNWLDWQTVLDEMGKNRSRTRKAYREFVEAGVDHEPSDVFQDVVANALLGSANWVKQMQESLGKRGDDRNVPDARKLVKRPTVAQIQQAVADEFAVEPSTIVTKRLRKNEARSAALYLIRKLTNERATDLAKRFGDVSPAAISKSVKRAEERLEESRWKKRLRALEGELIRQQPLG